MALTIHKVVEGPRDVHLIVSGSDEQYTDAVVYDISAAVGNIPNRTLETVGILKITYSVNGTEYDAITLEWDDSSSDPKAFVLRGEGEFDFYEHGAVYPTGIDAGTDTGDLVLTSPAVSSGDNHLTMNLHLRKKYVND